MSIPILDRIIQVVANLKIFFITLAFALAVISIIYAGSKYIFAPKEVSKTHFTLIFLILGILLVVSVFLLPKLMKEILGF